MPIPTTPPQPASDPDVLPWTARRVAIGLTLQVIADATKISSLCLQAIERGEFNKLPGGIYNTSYIRQYARQIDYDADAILSYYRRKTGQGDPPPPPSQDRPKPNARHSRLLSILSATFLS